MGALSSKALVTMQAVREYVLRDETDASKDALLTTLANGVSREVRRYCERQFFPDPGATYLFAWDGGTYLSLAPYEARTISAITVTLAGGSPITLDPSVPDYKCEPRNKTDEGTYLWLRLTSIDNPGAFPRSNRVGLMSEVAITGDWGMTELPEDLEDAVLMTIDWRYKNPSGNRSVQVGGLQAEAFTPQQGDRPYFPPEALSILDDLKRKQFGA